MTGGYLSQAAALATSRVANGVSADGSPFMHGPTFMANPLACAAALASLELLGTERWKGDVRRLGAGLEAALAPAAELPGVADVRVLGGIGVVELDGPVDVAAATAAAVEAGVWLRPFGRLIYAMPPYVCDGGEIAAIGAAIVAAAAAAT